MRKLTFACFVAVRVIWMSFAFVAREWKRELVNMLETPLIIINMSSMHFNFLPFHLKGITIAHMVHILERETLCHEIVVLTHVCHMLVVASLMHTIFMLMALSLAMIRDGLTDHVFPRVDIVHHARMAM